MHILEAKQHRFTTVLVLDEPGAGGAHHEFKVVGVDHAKDEAELTV